MERQRWTWVLLAVVALVLFGAACSLDGGKGKREQELRQILEHLIPDSTSMSEIEWSNCEEGGAPSSCAIVNVFWPPDTPYALRRDAMLEKVRADDWKLMGSLEKYGGLFYFERESRYLLVHVGDDERLTGCLKPTPDRNGHTVTSGCFDELSVGPLEASPFSRK